MEQETDTLDNNQIVRLERNALLRAASAPFMRTAVEKLTGINSNSWKRLEEKGVIPLQGSYAEVISAIVKYYQANNDAKLIAIEAKAEEAKVKRNYRSAETESGLPRIVEAEKIQKIKLDRAKEESIHLANLATKGNIINANEQFDILGAILSNIASELKAISAEKPETQETVDRCFKHLSKFGKVICEQVQLDGDRYISEKMQETVDLEEIVSMGLEL